ncbi:SCO4225 family membrane protein [Streptosporangium sp. CA-115845]|uniref:SCO4225 family membrane protein n=1 Tax=Streptosporangium sp. CA-115845 TaxID=3240071 RepID=UPI003D90D163
MRLFRAVGRYVTRYDRGTFALAIAGPYALIVIAATIYVEISTRQPGSQGLEALVLFAATSPISQLLMYLPLDSLNEVIFYWLYPAGGLFQAWLLWLIARGRRKSMPPAGASAPG